MRLVKKSIGDVVEGDLDSPPTGFDRQPSVPILVTASEAVVVERDLYRMKSPGLAA